LAKGLIHHGHVGRVVSNGIDTIAGVQRRTLKTQVVCQLRSWNRGRYFLLTGEKISAKQALDLGVVSEIMPRDQLMERAREHARKLLKQPPMTVTYARLAITHELKRLMRDHLDYGFLLEGLAATEYFPGKATNKPS